MPLSDNTLPALMYCCCAMLCCGCAVLPGSNSTSQVVLATHRQQYG